MKKIISITLVLLMLTGVLASCGFFESESEEGLIFKLNADFKGYTLVNARNCTMTDVVIDRYKGLPVTSIGDRAFLYCDDITSVIIGDSVTSIGDEAFECCSSLTSVTIGDSVTSIGERAFDGCSSLTSVYITDIAKWCGISFGTYDANPLYYAANLYLNGNLVTDLEISDGVTEIKPNAFHGCSSLTSVTIGDSVTSIGFSAFHGCSSLTSVTIPNSVTSIDDYAFFFCDSLTSVTIPNSVTSIGGAVFCGCSSLTSVTIGDSVTSIGNSAFYNCSSLKYNEYNNGKYLGNSKNPYIILVGVIDTSATSFTIHNTTKFIHSSAFEDCSSLTSVTITDSVTSIGHEAFKYCSSLTSITIPDSVTRIGTLAFDGCSSLKYNEYNNGKYLGNSKNPYIVLVDVIDTSATSFTIPDTTKIICDSAFSGCSSLTSITIPDSVTSIGGRAFYGCSSLTSVKFKNTEGWKVLSIEISSADLANTSTAATYLKSTYRDYAWTRS